MTRRDEGVRHDAEEKFDQIVHPPTEDTDIGSGAGGGTTGPGVTGMTGTGAARNTGMNVGHSSSGATGIGALDTGSGISGTGSADTTFTPGIAGADPASASMTGSAGDVRISSGAGDLPMRGGPGAAGSNPVPTGPTGRVPRVDKGTQMGSGTGAVSGMGGVGTRSMGPQHTLDPLESAALDDSVNTVTPDDGGGGVGMGGAGTPER
ncbi:MAG TPA: hypothetical protein VHL09_14155 [Dehalococcoidia bacterium]|nr:hypothetical protein [Dehalococcoidia bacterium]